MAGVSKETTSCADTEAVALFPLDYHTHLTRYLGINVQTDARHLRFVITCFVNTSRSSTHLLPS